MSHLALNSLIVPQANASDITRADMIRGKWRLTEDKNVKVLLKQCNRQEYEVISSEEQTSYKVTAIITLTPLDATSTSISISTFMEKNGRLTGMNDSIALKIAKALQLDTRGNAVE